MVSDFLNDVLSYPHLKVSHRVGNQVICVRESGDREMYFLATDESDWYGVLMAQYQGKIDSESMDRVRDLLRDVRLLPSLTRFECHEATREIRLVMRWPLHEEYLGYSDIEQIIPGFCDLWLAVEPLITRAIEGDDMGLLIAKARRVGMK